MLHYNQYLQKKGKAKQIEFSESCIAWFMAHSTTNLDLPSNGEEVICPG